MTASVDITTTRVCAFCKYWWDPACQYIVPHLGKTWFYNNGVKCKCIKKGVESASYHSCAMFKIKIEY